MTNGEVKSLTCSKETRRACGGEPSAWAYSFMARFPEIRFECTQYDAFAWFANAMECAVIAYLESGERDAEDDRVYFEGFEDGYSMRQPSARSLARDR